jgi:hypothetical protein
MMEVVFKHKIDEYNNLLVFVDGSVVVDCPRYDRATQIPPEIVEQLVNALAELKAHKNGTYET